jgi:hypothetical protein
VPPLPWWAAGAAGAVAAGAGAEAAGLETGLLGAGIIYTLYIYYFFKSNTLILFLSAFVLSLNIFSIA